VRECCAWWQQCLSGYLDILFQLTLIATSHFSADPSTVGDAIPTGYEGYGRGGAGGRGGRGAGRGRDGAFRGSRPAGAGASSGYGGGVGTGQAPFAFGTAQPPVPTMQMPMMPHMGQQPMMQPMMAPMGAPMMQQFPGGMMYAAPSPYAMTPAPVPYAPAQQLFRPPMPPSAAPRGAVQQQQAHAVPFMTAPAPTQGLYGYATAPMQPAGNLM
jgi:hypothetical protein